MPPAVAEIPGAPTAVIEHEHCEMDIAKVDSNELLAAPDISMPRNRSKGFDEDATINVDAFEYEDTLRQQKTSVAVCEGYTLIFPAGKTSHTAYPFALHDTIILPWDFALKNGVMKLFARSCHGLSEGSCQPC
jgi:hypothetical protein